MKSFRTSPRKTTAKISAPAKGPKASAPAAALAPFRLNLKKILVPVDFSDPAGKALRYGLALASQFGAEVTVVHIIEQFFYPGDAVSPLVVLQDYATEKQEQVLKALTALTKGSATKIKHVVRLGRAWQEIAKIATEEKSDLIVIATHGYTGLHHVLLGSVAEKVVRHAPCPVFVIR